MIRSLGAHAGELQAAYAESRPSLVRFLTRRLKNREAAEDLTQDVFVAISRVSPITGVRNPRSFLFRIAGNLALNSVQQETRRRQLRDGNADILWTAVDELTPERELLGREALAQIDQAVQELPERTRQILAWRRVDGLTNREIASRLAISETAVEKHMRSAMASLVRALDDGGPGRAG